MDGWMDGWMDGRMDGRTDGRTDDRTVGRRIKCGCAGKKKKKKKTSGGGGAKARGEARDSDESFLSLQNMAGARERERGGGEDRRVAVNYFWRPGCFFFLIISHLRNRKSKLGNARLIGHKILIIIKTGE
jgi:hypothetical protein